MIKCKWQEEQLNSNIPRIQSSHAILQFKDRYILQLRDDKPEIAEQGKWSLFGGIKRDNETPLEAIEREVKEELSIEPNKYRYLWFTDFYAPFEKTIIRIYFFASDVNKVWLKHMLSEGQAVKVFKCEQLDGLDMPPIMKKTIKRFHTKTKSK